MAPRSALSPARIATTLAAPLPALLFFLLGYAQRWVSEDAFIDMRVVRHLLAGHGPVFNLGERVEAYTSPLWVALLAVWGATGWSLEVGSVALGLILSTAGLVLAQVGAWHLAVRPAQTDATSAPRHLPDDRLGLPLGVAVFALTAVAWDFATSGLETGLVIFWLGGVFWLLARGRPMTRLGARLAALAIGCGPLVRPDLMLFSVGFAGALVVILRYGADRRPTRRGWVGLCVIASALPIGYQVFRMGYFAALVPNTALAKEASLANWSQGWRYAVDFVRTYALWFPILAMVALAIPLFRRVCREGDRASAALVLGPSLSAIAHGLYVTRVGGDFMHGRLLLPSLFGLLLPLSTVVVRARGLGGLRAVLLAAFGCWGVVSVLWLRVPYAGGVGPAGIADERGFYEAYCGERNPVGIGDYAQNQDLIRFNHEVPKHDRVVVLARSRRSFVAAVPLAASVPSAIRLVLGISAIGARSYLVESDVHVVDRRGLSDPIASRLELLSRGRPGHEKLMPMAWIVARFGETSALPHGDEDVSEAARAIRCGDLALLLTAVTAPLTAHQFLANIGDSWSLSRLRFPGDPTAARVRFCGGPASHPKDPDGP
jgi:arabinofuranosyltransferase